MNDSANWFDEHPPTCPACDALDGACGCGLCCRCAASHDECDCGPSDFEMFAADPGDVLDTLDPLSDESSLGDVSRVVRLATQLEAADWLDLSDADLLARIERVVFDRAELSDACRAIVRLTVRSELAALRARHIPRLPAPAKVPAEARDFRATESVRGAA